MTLGDIDTKITSVTNVDTTVYTVAQRLVDINVWLYKIQTMIIGAMDEVDFDDKNSTDYPEKTSPLKAGQRDYTIPASEGVIAFKRVDITYNGTDWYRATPVDVGELYVGMGPSSATSQQSKVDSLFSKTAPRYDPAFNSVRIFPMASAADEVAGASIFMSWSREMTPFTTSDYSSGTKVPGFDTAFHPMLAYGAAYEFFLATGQNQDAATTKVTLDDYERRLIQIYGKKEIDRTMAMVPIYSSYK